MVHTLKGKRQLISLWKEQNGLCPVCQQKMTKRTGWNNHHLIRRGDGGTGRQENRVLLHPNCHRQVHSQGFSVVKPRPAKGREFGLSGLRGNPHEPFLGGLGTATCPGYPARSEKGSRDTPRRREAEFLASRRSMAPRRPPTLLTRSCSSSPRGAIP
jgi:hypothetical protein